MNDEEFKMAVLDVLRDLAWVCSIMATELIRVAENTAVTVKGEAVLEKSVPPTTVRYAEDLLKSPKNTVQARACREGMC
ncbi:MAG: hypothetical protein KIH01_07600 [Candidatus Freyarchaeota archaeon]|nr:hypothetical protein [Candidatus Jordarchaeia archaeon]